MKCSQWKQFSLCAGLAFAFAGAAFAQDKKIPTSVPSTPQQVQQTKEAAQKQIDGAAQDTLKRMPATPDMAGMDEKTKAMMASMETNEHHKLLLQFVGEWDVKSKMWMAPEMPAMEAVGTASTKSEFGGRFVFMTYKSEIMGQPFEGRLAMGYNNNTRQNEANWIDNMSTGMWFTTGESSSDGKIFTFTGVYVEPDGEKKATREVTTFKSPDAYVSEFFETGKDGKEFKNMELTYTRKGKAADPAMKPAGTTVEPSK